MRPTLRPRRAGHVLLRAATQRMPKERKIGIGTPYEQSIDIEKKKKKEGETIIHVTIELYTYQGTIPIIFLSLFATFTSFYPLKNFSLAE